MKKNKNETQVKKSLKKFDVFVLAFGAMIGWGWVVLSSQWIKSAGTLGAVIAFVIGGAVVLFIGLVYSELTSAIPQNGGVLLFCLRGLGYKSAYICTWSIILGYISVIAFEVVALPTVLQYIFPGFVKGYLYTIAGSDVYLTWIIVGVAASVFIAVINILGAETAAGLQKFFTIILLVIGLILAVGSAVSGDPKNMQPLFTDSYKGVIAVAVMTPFMFVGIDIIPQSAEEMNIPFKKIGQILLLSVAMATVWYVMIIVSVSNALDNEALASTSLAAADAMSMAFNGSTIASKVLIFGGLAGIVTSWNAFYIGASRALCSMSRKGMLPKFLSELHPKYKTPYKAIIFICAVTSLAAVFGNNMIVWLADSGGFAVVVTYIFVTMAFLGLRKKEPNLNRPFKVKNWRLLFAVSIVLCTALLAMYMPFAPAALRSYEWGIIIAWAVLGIIMYLFAVQKNKN